MKTILVPGAGGQLGSELEKIQPEFPDFQLTFIPEASLDITDEEAVMEAFGGKDFDFCINCAAYTDVDQAEENQEFANEINANATGNLAKACKANNVTLFIFSTDYVFDGKSHTPYKEDDRISPINAYGHSKLKGEHIAANIHDEVICIRTSWLYSEYGRNFVKTILKLASKKEFIDVVNDQVGSPTYAHDLAMAVMHIITKLSEEQERNGFVVSGKYGTYHYSNIGQASWFDFASAIIEHKELSTIIKPVKSENFKSKAKRPSYAVLDQSKIMQTFDLEIPEWKKSLGRCLTSL